MTDPREEAVARIIDGEAFSDFALACERAEEVTFWPERREIALRKARKIAALPTGEEALREAFREGFQAALFCLPEGEGDELTGDVEQDCWADSKARALLTTKPADHCGIVEVGEDWNDPPDAQGDRP